MRLAFNFAACLLLLAMPTLSCAASYGCPYAITDADVPAHLMPQALGAELGQRLGDLEISKDYRGTLIQSFAFSAQTCSWVAAASLGRKPERVGLWQFSAEGSFEETAGPITSSAFSHPQDLSTSIGEASEYWLPSQDKLGVVRFGLDAHAGEEGVSKATTIPLFNTMVPDLFVAVSPNREFLVAMGKLHAGHRAVQTVRVYKVGDVEASVEKGMLPTPLSEWRLADEQQQKSQWRQGLAVIGHSVFVLTGNHAVASAKYLVAYGTSGSVLFSGNLPRAAPELRALERGQTYEPEGLDVVRHGDGAALVYGIATGGKGNRKLELRYIPLVGAERHP